MKDGRMLEGVGQSKVLHSTTNAKEPRRVQDGVKREQGAGIG